MNTLNRGAKWLAQVLVMTAILILPVGLILLWVAILGYAWRLF